jgi:hypothetical protein
MPATRWSSHRDLGGKALKKLAGPHMPPVPDCRGAGGQARTPQEERNEREHARGERERGGVRSGEVAASGRAPLPNAPEA